MRVCLFLPCCLTPCRKGNPVQVNKEWILTPWRLALHQPTRTAVVADLHLGYDQARRRSGEAVPMVDWNQHLSLLQAAVLTHEFKNLVIAGDLFERDFCPVIWHEFQNRLRDAGLAIIALVPGNHDRGLASETTLPVFPEGFSLGDWTILHGHGTKKAGKVIMGHWHPCIHYQGRRRPCFVVGTRRIVLPAYSDDAAGDNIWRQSQWRGQRCFVIAGEHVVDVGVIPGRVPSRANTTKTEKKSSQPWQGRLQRG
jgi:putative SbcD/Mre11-related phosphoesterase